MITPEAALEEILGRLRAPTEPESVPLAEARGRILARAAVADVDLPPFEKAMMDGFAVCAADFRPAGGETSLPCVGESRAGVPSPEPLVPGTCIEIYTGAELPVGADAVQMIEHTRRAADGQVVFQRSVEAGHNVGHRGEILRDGAPVLEPPRRLSPADLSVLAAIGIDPVPVFPRPRVSVLTTGDELVARTERPGVGQIREGNTLYLAAACAAAGCEVGRVGIVRDDPDELEAAFAGALSAGQILITTGGVSMGKYDLVGATFERLGVVPVLHKVAIKPGKPIWFGLYEDRPVFGLPGNPVSSLLGFEAFVRPALARLAGAGEAETRPRLARGIYRGKELSSRDRQHNVPARVQRRADGSTELVPLPWRGSADIVAVARADALVIVPADGTISDGELVDYRPLTD